MKLSIGNTTDDFNIEVGSQWAVNPLTMRISVAKAFSNISYKLNVLGSESFNREMLKILNSSSATCKLLGCLILWFWHTDQNYMIPECILTSLNNILTLFINEVNLI